jgi:hypothetical protein
MRRLGVGVVLALAATLAFASTAQAATIKHRGNLVGIPSAKVKFAVKKRDGDLKKLRDLTIKNIPVTCADGSGGTLDGQLQTFGLSGKRFTRKGPIRGPGIDNGFLRVAGKLRRNGKVAKGKVRAAFTSSAGVGCGTDNRAWKTKKK